MKENEYLSSCSLELFIYLSASKKEPACIVDNLLY